MLGVDKYYEFVPWCTDSKILKYEPEKNIMEGELAVGFKLLSERYTSVITWDRAKWIKVSVTSGKLFHYLNNLWTFEPGPEANTCWTSFEVAFKFRSEIHRTATDIFFNEVQKRMLHAFEERCQQLYGNNIQNS